MSNATSNNITHEVFRLVELHKTENGYNVKNVLNFGNSFHAFDKAEEVADETNIIQVWDKKGNLRNEIRNGVPTSALRLPSMSE